MERTGFPHAVDRTAGQIRAEVEEADWLSDFCVAMEGKPTPALYVRWAGVAAIAAVTMRRRWVLSKGETFLNMYITLCGAPATGKGVSMNPISKMLAEIPDVFLGSRSLTAASLVDELSDANVNMFDAAGNGTQFNPLTMISHELGVFLPAYDTIMMNRLTDLYDNGGYSERTRKSGTISIPNASLTILAGTTPAFLSRMLPEGAWNEGFMARMIVVYAESEGVRQITEEMESQEDFSNLIAGLKRIASRQGRVRWSKEGLLYLNEWLAAGGFPTPTHPKLQFYTQRRHFHLMKISAIFALSRHSDIISELDARLALDLLLETEAAMPEVFKAMKMGGDSEIIAETWHMIFKLYKQTERSVDRSIIIKFLIERTPAYAVDRIINGMEGAGMIQKVVENKRGECYVPLQLKEV